MEERLTYGPGRPSTRKPRSINALRYGLKATLRERGTRIARKRQEADYTSAASRIPSVEWLAPAFFATRSCRGQSSTRALLNQPPFELRQRRKDMEDEITQGEKSDLLLA